MGALMIRPAIFRAARCGAWELSAPYCISRGFSCSTNRQSDSDIEARADILRHVRGLVSAEGLSTLWATHLIDEVAETDTVIVLHRGKVLAQGIAADIVRTAGARDVKDAFSRLTGTAVADGS